MKRTHSQFARFMELDRLILKNVASWVMEREWHHSQSIKTRRTGEVELSFPATGMFEVMRRVLSWGKNVRVLAPTELVRMVTDEIKGMANNTRNEKQEKKR